MNSESSRKRLTSDEFVLFFHKRLTQIQSSKKQFIISGVIGFLVVAMGIAAYTYWTGKNQDASEKFAKILESLPTGQKIESDWTGFLTQINEFLQNHKYVGVRGPAFLYQAKALVELGKSDEALQSYTQAENSLDKPYGYLATEGRAIIYMNQGKYSEAKTIWDGLVAKNENPWKDFHLYNLGLVQMQLEQKDQAKLSFDKIVTDFKDSPYAEAAKNQLVP